MIRVYLILTAGVLGAFIGYLHFPDAEFWLLLAGILVYGQMCRVEGAIRKVALPHEE